MLTVYTHPSYTDALDPSVRFPRERYRLITERLRARPEIGLRTPRRATREELVSAHDPAFVDAFLEGRLDERAVRRIGLRPWTPEIIERTLRLVGGSLQAMEGALASGGIAGNLAGGTHHAHREFGSGYCIFNDLAICARQALAHWGCKRICILDLDVHQGDGTAAIFEDDPAVFTCSLHAARNFPFRKQASDLDVPLPDGMTDADYLGQLDAALARIDFSLYDAIFYQAGVDPLASDALGLLSLTRAGLDARNRRIFDLQRRTGLPLVLFMGGGYAQPISDTVDAFEDLFTVAAEYSSGG
jgi:acetoin utilization deacetylase AcuC-like enzyme